MQLYQKRIFIVEDDVVNRAITQLLVEKAGARTAIERWGTETVIRLRAFMPVNLILLDLMFPNNISGFGIFEEIKATSDLQHIPIVAVSAMDPSVAIPKCQEMGFVGFIPKPVSYALFASQIARILENEVVWETGRGSLV